MYCTEMVVYRLRAVDNAISLAFRSKAQYTRQHELTGNAVDPNDWSPPAVDVIRDGSGGTIASDLAILGVEPAFTGRAIERIGNLLRESGQVLPLLSADGEYYLWNVTTIIDALDEERCELHRFSSGRVMAVQRWAFRAGMLREATAFKIPQLLRAFTFVTGAFVDRLADSGLTGLAPERVWEEA